MRMIRYLSFIALIVFAVTPLWGQDDFNPSSPNEPGPAPVLLTLKAVPAEAGWVSGAGKHVPETKININAGNNTGFKFSHWTDEEGNTISTTAGFQITTGYESRTLTAHFDFDPTNPAEPVPGELLVYHLLTVAASEGGNAWGGGKYRYNTNVGLSASANTGYEFENWTNEEGEVVSTSSSFTYTTKTYRETITANFRFTPPAPEEPAEPVLRHKLTIICSEGGTSSGNQDILAGSGTTLRAYPNSGYVFVGWYVDDVLYSTLRDLPFTMGDEDVTFEARFEFNPDSPNEPTMPSDDKKYSLYLTSVTTYPGTTIDLSLYLTNLQPLGDMRFNLTLPDEVVPDWSSLKVGDKAAGYTVNRVAGESVGEWQFSYVGSTLPDGNTCLLSLKVNVPETTPVNTILQAKTNKIILTETDGTESAASTRNGNIYVYELGDSNGDGVVNLTDKMNVVLKYLGSKPESFIIEVSDVNEDGKIDMSDAMSIITKFFSE